MQRWDGIGADYLFDDCAGARDVAAAVRTGGPVESLADLTAFELIHTASRPERLARLVARAGRVAAARRLAWTSATSILHCAPRRSIRVSRWFPTC